VRIIFDTNIWSRLADEGSGLQFERLILSTGTRVILPPSTLVEVLHLPVPGPRKRIIELMAMGRRVRLTSEAELECGEVIQEIRRCHPEWMRSRPDTGKVASLNAFWTKRIQREAVEDSRRLHDYQRSQQPIKNFLVDHHQEMRSEAIRTEFNARPLTGIKATANPDAPEAYLRGWDGSPAEVWRVATREIVWHALRVAGRATAGEGTTYADWLGAYVDLAALKRDPAAFTAFWLEEVDVQAVPRQWLRWAVNTAQTMFKVTGGNPADEQHSAYLIDCDYLSTADARYAEVLTLVREDAPFPMATAVKVSGDTGRTMVDRL
jgi:hypothetical protein